MPTLSVVLPYFNEAEFLPEVLRCARHQTQPPDQFIAVDNGSTDGSPALCRRALSGWQVPVEFVSEPREGKIAALVAGCERVTGDITVFWDADTHYPPDYLARCLRAFSVSSSDTVAVFAIPLRGNPDGPGSWLRRQSYLWRAWVWPRQVLTGGFGQAVRTDALRAIGGFSEERWPYVLLDHEIMHRVFTRGRGRYHPALWCRPSNRRRDRQDVRWGLGERLLYHLTPYILKDWYFYRFLGPRLRRRGLSHLNLRHQPWRSPTERDPPPRASDARPGPPR